MHPAVRRIVAFLRNWEENMFKRYTVVVSSVLLLATALAWGQQESNRRPASSYDLLPAGADVSAKREAELAEQLERMQASEAVMGENHPQRENLRSRIVVAAAYLENLRSIPNPFKQLEEQGVKPRDIVEQLSEKELRLLVVRLAVDLKDMQKRVELLEERIASKRQ